MNSVTQEGEARAYERLALEEARIQVHLKHVFSTAQHINAMNAALIEAGELDFRSQADLQRDFLIQIQEYSFISSIYFGNRDGGLANAGRQVNTNDLYFIGTEDFGVGDFLKYPILADGTLGAAERLPGFDARTRPWYQNAVAAENAVWSDIYPLFTNDDLAIAASHPVYAADGSLLGVAACDIFLGQLSDFLAASPVSAHGQSLLVDHTGHFIASSQYDVLTSGSELADCQRNSLQCAESLEIRALNAEMLDRQLDFSTLTEKTTFRYDVEGAGYFISMSPFQDDAGLDLIAIVILPEVDILSSALARRRVVLYVFALLGILMIFLSWHISRLILVPLLKLQDDVQKFDIKNRKNIFVKTRFREINAFSAAFNTLVQRLDAALDYLHLEIAEHKESKSRLLWSETLYRSVVEDSPGLLCSFLPSGEITFANKSYAAYYNTTPEALVGTNFQALLHEDDREDVMAKVRDLNKENPSNFVIQRSCLVSGEVRHQRWVNRALFSDSGELIGVQAFGEDIEKEYQIQQAQSALYRILRASNHVADLEDLYPAIHEIVQEIISVDRFAISLFDEETQRLQPVYCAEKNLQLISIPANRCAPSDRILETNASLLCTKEEIIALQLDQNVSDANLCLPKVWLGVPLTLHGKIVGVMAVQDYKNEKAIGNYEQEFFEMIAPSVAATIARRRAEENLAIYAQTNALLFNASQNISNALDLDQLYSAFYISVLEMMDCDFFMVSDYNAQTQNITCQYLMQNGKVQDISEFPPLPLNPKGEGTQSRVIIDKKSRIIADYLAEIKTSLQGYYVDDDGNLHDVSAAASENPITRSALIVPLYFKGEVSGVIQVMSYRQSAYSLDDLHTVEAITNQLGVVRNNIGLYQQAQTEIKMRTEAEKELQELNIRLEERIKERTKDLHQRIATVEKLNTGMSNILHDLNIANKKAEANAGSLREANAELEAFSYSVSHDLRAPLRHIESFTRLLHDTLADDLDEKATQYFNNIFTASTKMRNLIQDMLLLSRAGRIDFKFSQIDMNEMVENVRAELFDQTEGRDIQWTLATLPPAQADAGLIKIVWMNLIGNAVKYTRLNEKTIIEIGSLCPEDENFNADQPTFFVRDNGVGFDEIYIDQLFGVFQRLHEGNEFEGNGIGLATVRRIILRHGGKVWAKSVLGKGSTFYFSLPQRI